MEAVRNSPMASTEDQIRLTRQEWPKLILIVGASRSGSTLLDRLVGAIPGCESLGEIHQVWQRGFIENHKCGCGAQFQECPFWHQVKSEMTVSLDAAETRALQQEVVSNWNIVGLSRRLKAAAYVAILERLYLTIARVSGSSVLVDSSKRPAHANLLLRHSELDVNVLHLVRDSRAMAFSCQRIRRKSDSADNQALMARLTPGQAGRAWLMSNLMSEAVGRRSSSYSRIRYEDLVSRPGTELLKALPAIQLSSSDLDFIADGRATLPQAHTVSGNPMRMTSGDVRIVPDEEWRQLMNGSERARVSGITWPLLLRYHYPLRIRA